MPARSMAGKKQGQHVGGELEKRSPFPKNRFWTRVYGSIFLMKAGKNILFKDDMDGRSVDLTIAVNAFSVL